MFCKFCGKEIPEGSVCDCRTNINANQQSQQQQIAQQAQMANDIKGLLLASKEVLLSYFKKPLDTAKQVYLNTTGNETYVIGGIFFVLAFAMCVMLTKDFSAYVQPSKIGLWVVIILLLEKVGFSGMLYAFARRDGASFKQIVKVVCLTTMQLSACILLVMLFNLMGVATGLAIMAITYVLADVLTGIIVINAVIENKNVGYWVYVAITCVIIVVGYIVLRNAVMTAVDEIMSSFSSMDWLF